MRPELRDEDAVVWDLLCERFGEPVDHIDGCGCRVWGTHDRGFVFSVVECNHGPWATAWALVTPEVVDTGAAAEDACALIGAWCAQDGPQQGEGAA